MAPKRKNARPLITKPPTTPSETIFFYHLNVKPYDIFCQWKPSPFTIPVSILLSICALPSTPLPLAEHGEQVTFTCAEQAYMFFKALYFDDQEACRKILDTKDPGEQKTLGKQVKGFSDEEWDTVKSRVARTVNWYKFTHPSNAHMKAVLLETEQREIAEASSRDRVWGIGYKEEVAEKYRKNWGQNRLGRALMDVRTRIRGCQIRDQESGVRGEWEWNGGDKEEGVKEE